MRPSQIKLHQKSRLLEVTFEDQTFQLPCEYLRVFSPSAEVRGHGPGQEVLVAGKANVNINNIEPVGHYAVKLIFDDGHDSGLYDWKLLHNLGEKYDTNWQGYLDKLADANLSRQP